MMPFSSLSHIAGGMNRASITWIAMIVLVTYFPHDTKGQEDCATGSTGIGVCMEETSCSGQGWPWAGRPSSACPTVAGQPSQVCCSFSTDNPAPTGTESPTTTTKFNSFFPTESPLFAVQDPFNFVPPTFNSFVTSPPVASDKALSPIGGQCGRISSDGSLTESSGSAFSSSSFSDLTNIGIEAKEDGNKIVNESLRGDVRSLRKNSRVKRIVGGEFVASNDLCYQVAILQGNTLIATGALISNDYVISTYSPLVRLTGSNSNGRGLRVLLGGPNILTSFLQGASTADVFTVTQVFSVPGFVQKTALGYPSNDMALLKFARNNAVLDTSRICAICIPPQPLRQENCQRVFVSGYGTTSESATTTDNNLRRVGVTLIPSAVCDNVFRAAFKNQGFRLDTNSLCAGGETGRDTCSKDGGAPLVCEAPNSGNDGSRYLIGLSSWGFGCGRAGYPGVYTNISSNAMATFIRTTAGIIF